MLLSSEVISKLIWKTNDVPCLQEAFVKRLHGLLITHSLSDCKNIKALPKA